MKREKVINIGGRLKAFPSEIIMLQAEINYTKLYFSNGNFKIVATTLRELENRLAPFDFIRIHKSFLINLDCLADNQPENPYLLRMNNDVEVAISRRRFAQLSRIVKAECRPAECRPEAM